MSQLFVKEKIFCQRGKGALREYTARSSSMGWHCRISDEKETQHFSYMSNKYILPFSCHRQLHFSKTQKKKKEHTVINFSKKGQNVISVKENFVRYLLKLRVLLNYLSQRSYCKTAVIKETLSTDKEKELSVSCRQEFIGKLLSDSSHSYNAVI